ncbi:MAG: Omp28-related outer membrane protein [Bacteroidales bacterium]|nr:Omp28-related outer membrane protein [Bacteroidales bacterium]
MRKLIYIFSILLTFASCSGYIDPNDPDNVPEGVLRVFADRTAIAADGLQQVTFTVKFGSKDVSKDADMNLICITGDSETSLRPGVNTFSTTVAAEYRFKARYYSGTAYYSDNEVVVKASEVAQSVGVKNYHRRLWGMQFTAVSCTYCPRLTANLKKIMQENPGRIVLTAFHVMFDESVMTDPMKLTINEDFRDMVKHGDGLPLFAFNMVKDAEGIVDQEDKIRARLSDHPADEQASCGVALSTTYDSGTRSLSITGKVTSNVPEQMRYHILLVEDGVEYAQAGEDAGYVHNAVVRDVLSDSKWGDRLNNGVKLGVGVEASVTRTVTVDRDWKPENMKVVFAALRQSGDSYICANINECDLGGSADYIYNE